MKGEILMRIKKWYGILAIVIITGIIMSGCGASYSKNDSSISEKNASDSYGGADESVTEDSNADYDIPDTEEQITNNSSINSLEPEGQIQDKIIRRINMELETREFDNLINTIDKQIDLLGGYVERSEITGQRYNKSNSLRYGVIVARIPKKRLNDFTNTVEEEANVVYNDNSTENVTIEYIDVESHKIAMEIEQERLLALLEKTDTLEDIIVLESRLSNIRYELQKYETQLRTYDNLVEYSTVTMSISEVERISSMSEEEPTVWNRIKTGISDTMYHLSRGAKNFFVWFVVNIPYIIIWIAIIGGAYLVGRRYLRKKVRNTRLSSDETKEQPKEKKENE